MVVEYGIMSNKWSVEAPTKLICYATILIHIGTHGYNMVVLYNEECKDDQWTFCDNMDKRMQEIFGEDVFSFMDRHEDDIRPETKMDRYEETYRIIREVILCHTIKEM